MPSLEAPPSSAPDGPIVAGDAAAPATPDGPAIADVVVAQSKPDVPQPVVADAEIAQPLVADAATTVVADTAVAPPVVADGGSARDAMASPSSDATSSDATSAPALALDTAPVPSAVDAEPANAPGVVTGMMMGLAPGKKATVILGSAGFMASQTVAAGARYRFSDVPAGTYFLKVQVAGYSAGPARTVQVADGPSLAARKAIARTAVQADSPAPVLSSADSIDITLAALPADPFRYHWEEDVSQAGYEETAYINQPPAIQYLSTPVDVPDLAAADTLVGQFNVILSNEDVTWNQEYAYRLLETLKTIPQPTRKDEGDATLLPSKWTLTDRHIDGDIELVFGATGTTVTISADAFVYATPLMVVIDGERGAFFSKRLHHALVSYVTHNGTDSAATEKILQDRFGCTSQIPDYKALTLPTTQEDAGSFQAFHPEELVQIINMFEEMPDGFHKVPGLKYLVRRLDGMPNPKYANAAAVAWAWPQIFPDGGYIEFMTAAFTADPTDTHRLILHEKAHFLWAYVFSQTLRQDWTTLGGWYPDASDPDGWSTTKTTEFVSAYAHQKNPDEDMAESIAFFVLDPANLQSRAMEKYEFVRDRIMQGTRYLAQVQKDLTFEVLDLYPDYEYPGKIKRAYSGGSGRSFRP